MDFLSKNSTAISAGSGAVSSVAGTMMGARAAKASGAAAASADLYNASAASTNADIALQNASVASDIGNTNAGITGQKARADVAAITASQGASGVRIDSGSNSEVRASAVQKGMLDAMTVRNNATREAYGLQTEAANFKAEAGMQKNKAVYDRQAGKVAARTTMVGGLSSASKDFGEYLRQSSMTAGTPTVTETTGGGGEVLTAGGKASGQAYSY